MSMDDTRVLKAHKEAVKSAIESGAETADALFGSVAQAVLTALDNKIRYVVVTDDYLAFGPYASRGAAENAIAKGNMAFREGTRAMVLPMSPSPKAQIGKTVLKHPHAEQLPLF